MKNITSKTIRLTRTRALVFLSVITAAAAGAIWFDQRSRAASPSSGSINSTIGATAPPWIGDRVVTGAANGEPSCSNGDSTAVNCDVYELTVNGVPGDWVGELISIRFNWLTPASDYD